MKGVSKILIAFLIVSYNMLGQNAQLVLKPFQYTFSEMSIISNNRIYAEYAKGHYFDNTGINAGVIKLDFNLNILDTVSVSNLVDADTSLFKIGSITSIKNRIYVLIGYSRNDSIHHDIIILDTLLTVQGHFTLSRIIDGRESLFFDLAIADSTIYASGLVKNMQGYDDGIMLATDLNGNTLHYSIIKADSLSNFSRDAHLNSLFVGDTTVIGTLQYAWDEHLAVFNRNLNLLDLKSLFTPLDTFGYQGRIDFVNNDRGTPLIHSVTSTYDWNYKPNLGEDNFYKTIGLVELDNNYEILKRDTLPFTGWQDDTLTNFIEYSEFGSASFSFSSEDTIVSAVTDNIVFWATWPVFQLFNVSTNTYISAFDNKNKSVIWSKVYNNGVAHKAEEVTALPNNRWLLSFNEYDWNTYGPNNLAVRLMIIDGNGNPIGINEDEEKALAQEPIVYPNPANDYLTVANLHWPGNDYTYQISDANGRVVQKGALPIGGNITLAENLHGIYVLTITNQTGFGWARKVVLE
jgi:hypothetical protein